MATALHFLLEVIRFTMVLTRLVTTGSPSQLTNKEDRLCVHIILKLRKSRINQEIYGF
jgi:hypothetical protein